MKMITAILISLLSIPALAQTAWFPVGKVGAATNYAAKQVCESAEGHPCIDVGKCPLDECSVVDGKLAQDAGKVQAKEAARAAAKAELDARKAKAQELVGLKGKKLSIAEAVRAVELWTDLNADSLLDDISQASVRNQVQAKSK